MALFVNNLPANAGDVRDPSLIPRSVRSPGGAWQPTPVFFSRESHGRRSPVSYSPGGSNESDTTEAS